MVRRRHEYDAYGERYWDLTSEQKYLLAALPITFERLRDVINQAAKDKGFDQKRTKWEKLHVLGYLDVDLNDRKWVMVKRGPRWEMFWRDHGIAITKDTLMTKEWLEKLGRELGEILREPVNESP